MKNESTKTASTRRVSQNELDVLAARIREAHAGEAAKDFALRVGIVPQALSRYEAGGNAPGADILRRICAASGVSADWLLGLSETKMRSSHPVTASTVNAPATQDAAAVLAQMARILAPAKAPVPPTPDVADLTRRLDALDNAVSRLASIVAAVLPKA